jgi:hypothetical protein
MLAPFGSASDYANHGKRVVAGQRMMQAATGVFLGWTRAPIDSGAPTSGGLRDSRLADIGTQLQSALPFYVSLCGRTLARAHARAGDPALVSGYVGKGEAFEGAISAFAVAQADQTETDWQSFRAAIKTGDVIAAEPEAKKD